MRQFTDHYLRTALLASFGAAALWTLVALFGFTSLEASGADATASALGLVICFLVVFIAAILALGTYDVWKNTGPEDVLETALWAAPVQRERLGFVLMAGGLLLLTSTATGAVSQPVWPALSGLLLFGGGLILVATAIRGREPIAPLAVARTRYRSISITSEDDETEEDDEVDDEQDEEADGPNEDESNEDESNEDGSNEDGSNEDEVPEQDETKTSDGGSTPQASE